MATSQSPQIGVASVYSDRLNGHPTASGEAYDCNQLTAAHRTLPIGTRVRVTNLANRKSVVVRINDRGPHVAGRILDLSLRAAQTIGAPLDGVVKARVDVIAAPMQQ